MSGRSSSRCPIGCVEPCPQGQPCWLRGCDDVQSLVEAEGLRRRERVNALLLERGRPDLAAGLAAKLRDIDTGVYTAQTTWQALSSPQRRLLEMLATGRTLVRCQHSRTTYDAIGEPHAMAQAARLPTVRAMAARELIAWDGGAFDPEARAVLTERGRFVERHGREMRGK